MRFFFVLDCILFPLTPLETMVSGLLQVVKKGDSIGTSHEDAVFRVLYFFTKV